MDSFNYTIRDYNTASGLDDWFDNPMSPSFVPNLLNTHPCSKLEKVDNCTGAGGKDTTSLSSVKSGCTLSPPSVSFSNTDLADVPFRFLCRNIRFGWSVWYSWPTSIYLLCLPWHWKGHFVVSVRQEERPETKTHVKVLTPSDAIYISLNIAI